MHLIRLLQVIDELDELPEYHTDNDELDETLLYHQLLLHMVEMQMVIEKLEQHLELKVYELDEAMLQESEVMVQLVTFLEQLPIMVEVVDELVEKIMKTVLDENEELVDDEYDEDFLQIVLPLVEKTVVEVDEQVDLNGVVILFIAEVNKVEKVQLL